MTRRISGFLFLFGIGFWLLNFAFAGHVQAQNASPAADPVAVNCTDPAHCEIWFAAPQPIDPGTGEWIVTVDGQSVQPDGAIAQDVHPGSVMFVLDTSDVMRVDGGGLTQARDWIFTLDQTLLAANTRLSPDALSKVAWSMLFIGANDKGTLFSWCELDEINPYCPPQSSPWEKGDLTLLGNAPLHFLNRFPNGDLPATDFVAPLQKALGYFDGQSTPRAIICICEGLEAGQPGKMDGLIKLANAKSVHIYVKHVWKAAKMDATDALTQLANATGGIFVPTDGDFTAILNQVAQELSPYRASFALSSAPNHIKIDYRDPQGVLLTLVDTKLAPAPAPSATPVPNTTGQNTPVVAGPVVSTPELRPIVTRTEQPVVAFAVPTLTPNASMTTPIDEATAVTPLPTLVTITPTAPVTPTPDPCSTGNMIDDTWCQLRAMLNPGNSRYPTIVGAVSLFAAAGLVLLFVRGVSGKQSGVTEEARDKDAKKEKGEVIAPGDNDDTEHIGTRGDDTEVPRYPFPIARLTLVRSPAPEPADVLLYANTSSSWAIGRIDEKLRFEYPAANRIILAPKVVSKVHALLTFDGEHFYLEDAMSAGGTYVNQVKAEPYEAQRLDDGDFSAVTYRFQVDKDALLHAFGEPEKTSVAPDGNMGLVPDLDETESRRDQSLAV